MILYLTTRSTTVNVGGKDHEIQYVVTRGERLWCYGNAFMAVLAGCPNAAAAKKIDQLMQINPELRHGSKKLEDCDKVIILCLDCHSLFISSISF
jgi:hypothetical protein